ncbi:EpsG family protein [Vibrio sp.]|uniref:EpsG family protein n=1 Tax=Vibrio sp. TaxID=678 RepID=UPI00311F3542
MSSRKVEQHAIINFFIYFGVSCFIVLIPWQVIRDYPFVDIINYVARYNLMIENDSAFGFAQVGSIKGYIFSEALWAYFLYIAGKFNLSPYLFLYSVSFLCCFLISWFTISRIKSLVYAILLINPLLIDLVMSQQRSALMFVMVLAAIACYERHKIIFFLLFCVSFSVHMSSIILFSFLTLSMLFGKFTFHKNENVNTLIIFQIIMFGSLVVIVGQDAVLAIIGDRRAYSNSGSQSLIYASAWGALLVLFIVFSKHERNGLFFFTVSLMSLFVISTLFNAYSSRYLAFAFPFILIYLSHLRDEIRLPFLSIILSYILFQWALWLQLFS